MKRFLLAASALVIAAAPIAASAQPNGGRWGGRGGRDRGGQQTQTQTTSPSVAYQGGGRGRSDGEGRRGGWGGSNRDSQPNTTPAPQAQPQSQADNSAWRGRRGGDGQSWQGRRGGAEQGSRGGRGIEGRNPDGSWNRGDGQWNGGDRSRRGDGQWNRGDRDGRRGGWERGRRGPGSFQWRGRSYRSHRAPAYRWAPGFYYGQRWGIGSILPQLLFRDEYIVRDYWSYDLPPPPPGTYYLRVGGDLYIVTYRGGRVVEIIPDVFYYEDGYGW